MASYLRERVQSCGKLEARELSKVADKLAGCASWLLFRHYTQRDSVRLHAAPFCHNHHLCPFCAMRRGTKLVQAYMARTEVVRSEEPWLRPSMITCTVRDGPDLDERFKHLRSAWKELMQRRRLNASCGDYAGTWLANVDGGVISYEVKRGTGSGEWHPHLHGIVLSRAPLDMHALRDEWHEITGDSHQCDVREMYGEADGFLEVFKYALKFSTLSLADNFDAWRALARTRMVSSFGCYRGVIVPDELTDDELSGPFVELMYRYLHGVGFSLTGVNGITHAA
jgi:hypothetical protein